MKKLPIWMLSILLVAFTAVGAPAFADDDDDDVDVTISGSVVRYEPGRTIVIRGEDDREVTYSLTPELVVPDELRVGASVTLYTEPSTAGGAVVVHRIVSGPPSEVVVERAPASATMHVTGRVVAYESGRSITLVRDDGTREVYVIASSSNVPRDLVVGKTIQLVPVVSSEPNRRVVKTITYVTAEPPGRH